MEVFYRRFSTFSRKTTHKCRISAGLPKWSWLITGAQTTRSRSKTLDWRMHDFLPTSTAFDKSWNGWRSPSPHDIRSTSGDDFHDIGPPNWINRIFSPIQNLKTRPLRLTYKYNLHVYLDFSLTLPNAILYCGPESLNKEMLHNEWTDRLASRTP